MQRAVRCLAATCLIASLAVLLVFAVSSRTIWGGPPGDAKATGSLTVKIKPPEAKQAGARWRVDGGAWQKSGRTVSGLSVGQHTVTFKSIADWNTPKQKKPAITANQTTTTTGKYVMSATGPTAAFSATPTSGDAPLVVQFTDESTPGGSPITSWEWDFENDGVVDSTEQNPQPTFQDVGLYDVKLTVGSASGPDSLTKNDYIIVESDNYDVLMLPGDVPLEMVRMPAGQFMMGRYANELDGYMDEDPQHQVTFEHGFWMGKYEVTQAQWVAVMGSNPSYFDDDPSRPVETVSWDTVQTFVTAVNELGHGTFRLPSEAEWEYACRAGTTTRLYWGEDLTYAQVGDYAWYYSNSSSIGTRPVGQKLPNAWGLYDMAGNVEEWCEDWYHNDYTGAPTDGTAWVSSPSNFMIRITRGGSWRTELLYFFRSATRAGVTPSSNLGYAGGFRLAGVFTP